MILGDDQSPHTIKWVNSLSDEINTICLVSFHKVDKSLYHENVKIVTIDVIRDNMSNIDFVKFGYLRLVKIVKQELKNFKPDILHAYYASSYGLIGALSGFNPFVISVWGSDVFEFPKKSFIHKSILKYNLRKADYIQSTSMVMAEEIAQYTDKNIIVVPFGIDLDKYKPIPEIKAESGDTIVIGTVKWLQAVYGINYLIDAFYLLTKKYNNIKLLIVGGGPRLKEYQTLVRKYNIVDLVEFTGSVPIEDTVKYHNQIDIFAVLSLRESFGVSALEAAACCVPTVVSNVGGLPEVVQDKKTGFIVEPRNPQSAADAISKLIEDVSLREEMSVNARKFVKRKYDWSKNVQDQIGIYESIILKNPINTSLNKKRVCHISTVHPRNDIRIFHKECKSLSKEYDVSMIVADGKGDDTVEGIRVYDIGLRQTSRIRRARIDSEKALKKALSLNCNLYHIHDPELIKMGEKLKKRGKRLIYDTHEDLPRQIVGKPYINKYLKPFIARIIEWQENKAARKFDYICSATPFIRDRFLKINPNTIDINNYPIRGELYSPDAVKEDYFCYTGGITEERGIINIVSALENSDLKAVLAGPVDSEAYLNKMKERKEWENVRFLGLVSREEVGKVMSSSIAGLVLFLPLPNHINAQPNKIFEYMSAGVPVIGSNFELWKSIIVDNNCGLCVDPENPLEIAEAMNYLRDNPEIAQEMGENGKKTVVDIYNWANEEKKLFKVYKSLCD